MPKTLVFFHYYEANETYIKNLLHFLYFGYVKDAHYVIIIAEKCSVDLPKADNITYINAPNTNWDYGGYCHAIKNIKDVLDYDYYFFVNCSVRGPFVPPYIHVSWHKIFIDLMVNDVGFIGATINKLSPFSPTFSSFTKRHSCNSADHVQTPMYAMTKAVFQYLLDYGFYDIEIPLTKDRVIEDYELLLSKVVLEGGWKIRCLLPEFEINDINSPRPIVDETLHVGDVVGPKRYFGRTPHPYETVFVKTNRFMFTNDYLERLAHSMYRGRLGIESGYQSSYTDELMKISKMYKEIEIEMAVPRLTMLKRLKNFIKNAQR